MEHYENFEDAKARFDELRSESYNGEKTSKTDGRSYARLTLGVESVDGEIAADILHVHGDGGAGKNYLVTDFSRTERMKNDPEIMEILTRAAREIGFDRVVDYEKTNGGYRPMPEISFAEWENPCFETDTPEKFTALSAERGRQTGRNPATPKKTRRSQQR